MQRTDIKATYSGNDPHLMWCVCFVSCAPQKDYPSRGAGHVQRHLNQSLLINSQKPLSWCPLISLMSAHLLPATAPSHSIWNVLAAFLLSLHYQFGGIYCSHRTLDPTIRDISINSFWYEDNLCDCLSSQLQGQQFALPSPVSFSHLTCLTGKAVFV